MAQPKKLQTICTDLLRDKTMAAGRAIIAAAICAKLEAQGIPPETFPVDEYLDYLRASNKGDFEWKGGPDITITITFTPKEEAAIADQIDELLSLWRDGARLTKVFDASANALLKENIKRSRASKAHEETELYDFRKRLGVRWGKALDLYRLMLGTSYDLFCDMERALRKSESKSNFFLKEALIGIQARALRTGRAVLVLLEHGMADEAYTRWRTLYELSIVAFFLGEHGDKAARMYREHEVVANKGRIDNSLKWKSPLGTKRQRMEIERDYHYVIQKYGEGFKKPYGWASPFLGGTNPRFVDLEAAIRGQPIVPPYKESSFQVHGGRAGLLGLGSLDGLTVTTAYSNAGLDIPLMHSSLAIMQITMTSLFYNPARDLVIIKLLMLLDDKIHAEARRAARQLEQNHKEEDSK